MPYTRVTFEVNDCDDQDEALERIRSGSEEPTEFSVEDDE